MRLLTDNDLAMLRQALSRGKETTLDRSGGGMCLRVRTEALTAREAALWGVGMVLTVGTHRGCVDSVQNLRSVDELERMY